MVLEFIAAIAILFLAVLYLTERRLRKKAELIATEALSRKQSLSTKYGKMTEQFMPLLDNYPYNPENFRFLGTPIDGIQFEDGKIIFVEFKAADSKLTTRQRNIKNTVEKGNVKFEEMRI